MNRKRSQKVIRWLSLWRGKSLVDTAMSLM